MNNGRWTPEEELYIRENVGKKTFAEMGEEVGRTELAVQLFIHRKKIITRSMVKRNLVQEILTLKFIHPDNFLPTRKFYNAVKINQMRWWDLFYGRKQITQIEYIALSNYFGLTLEEAFETRQLSLFDDDK